MKNTYYYHEQKNKEVKRFYIGSCDLGKWLHQNKADLTFDIIPLDYVDGCLLDNMLVETKRGIAAIYEHYLNCWTSDYLVEWQAGNGEKVFNNWKKFVDSVENA